MQLQKPHHARGAGALDAIPHLAISPSLCDTSRSVLCLSISKVICRAPLARRCGLFSCKCSLPPHTEQPWEVLGINLTFSPDAVERAFQTKSWVLHPEHNSACLRRASAEFTVVKRARATLMSMSATTTAAGWEASSGIKGTKKTLACNEHWRYKTYSTRPGERTSIMDVAMGFLKRQTAKLHQQGHVSSWWGWVRRLIGSQIAAVCSMFTRASIVTIFLSVIVLQSMRLL